MTDITVKVFRSTDTGAPSVSGTAGSLITLLDACLANGYNSVTLTSLAVSGNVATATKANHGFSAVGTVGPVVRIAGATPSELNGDWRIVVVDADTFTFATSGISDQTATGTITAKRAPAGFSKVFSGTNKAAYRADDVNATRLYLRVDDTTTTYATVKGYETMSDVDTGTGSWPSTARYLPKSSAASSTARPWVLIADGRLFFLVINSDGGSYFDDLTFGDILSYKAGDAYHCWLCAGTVTGYGNGASSGQLSLLNNSTGSDIARSYTQTGSSVSGLRHSHRISNLHLGEAGNAYPSPVDNGFHAWPVEIWEGSTAARGILPGVYNPIHNANPANGTIITDVPQLSGRSLLVSTLVNQYRAAFDISGPWR